MTPTEHEDMMRNPIFQKLKIWPQYFQAKLENKKPWEYREIQDRTFKVGHTVLFREFDPDKNEYTGREYGPCEIVYVFITQDYHCIFTHTTPGGAEE